MSTLSDARSEAKTLLAEATDKQAFDYLPGAFQPPAWVVNSGSPYVASGGPFGSILVRLDLCYFTRSAANAVVTREVDDVLEDALVGLIGARWSVEGVTVEALTANSATYLGAVVTVTKNFPL